MWKLQWVACAVDAAVHMAAGCRLLRCDCLRPWPAQVARLCQYIGDHHTNNQVRTMALNGSRVCLLACTAMPRGAGKEAA